MVSKGGLAENVTMLSQQLPKEGHFLFHLGAFLSWEVNIVGQCLRRNDQERKHTLQRNLRQSWFATSCASGAPSSTMTYLIHFSTHFATHVPD